MRSRGLAAAILFTGYLTVPAAAAPAGWRTYSDEKLGYAISYPGGWKLDTHYIYVGFGPDHEIRGVAFAIPQSLAKGTNLSAHMTTLSVETVPGTSCNAARFIANPPGEKTVREDGRRWTTARSEEGAAGNFYDTVVYALSGSAPCLGIRYSIHTTNIDNYEPGTVRPFDRSRLLEIFGAIRRTLRLRPAQQPRAP